MSTVITVAWIGVAALGVIDALRRSSGDWDYADRNRPFWVVFMIFLGPLCVIPYLIFVVPRFPNRAVKQNTDQFTKR
jgi:tryptophan-rich sensory protein